MDWQTGQVNAKYWVTNLLATTVGDASEKSIVESNASVTGGAPSPAPGSTGQGTCGSTNFGGSCDVAARGAFNSTAEGIKTLQDCVAKVSSCKYGNYASFSASNQDCSWYEVCDMSDLMPVSGAQYESQVIHAAPDSEAAAKYLYAMPYIKQGSKGVMLVNKQPIELTVTLSGVSGGEATVVEATGAQPGLNSPVAREISSDGALKLGPFAVAVVTTVKDGSSSMLPDAAGTAADPVLCYKLLSSDKCNAQKVNPCCAWGRYGCVEEPATRCKSTQK